MTVPGEVYSTGVASIGGRGQQATMPFDHVKHTVTMTTVSRTVHEDRYVTADQAIIERIGRLREQGVAFTRDGMKLTYIGFNGDEVTLEYGAPA